MLKAIIPRIPASLTGRVARNIYFWLYMVISKAMGTDSDLPAGLFYGLLVFNIFFFIIPCTVNNFVLIPYLLRKKKYLLYIGSFWCLVFFFAFTYTFWLKLLMVKIPGIDVFDVSIEAPKLTNDMSWHMVLEESWSPFWIFLAIVFSFTGMWYINNYAHNERMAQAAVKKQVEAELNFLKHQINPHFLFNTLNNLYGLALKKSDQAPEAILRLSSVMRYILYEAGSELISFEKEKEIIQAYIDIEMLRFPETADIQFSIVSSGKRSIPPLLWLPVLENVFKHGANTLNDECHIDFRFIIEEHKLSIYSRNTFDHRSNQHRAKNGGIGLSNLRKRLEILFPGKYSIEHGADAEGLYTVSIQINQA